MLQASMKLCCGIINDALLRKLLDCKNGFTGVNECVKCSDRHILSEALSHLTMDKGVCFQTGHEERWSGTGLVQS